MFRIDALVVTCEHGGNRVPPAYKHLFEGHEELLDTHRGHDKGALEMAREIAERYGCPLHFSTTTRLLVDLNRSVDNPKGLFTEVTGKLSTADKQRIIDKHYTPYRSRAESALADLITAHKRVLHLSIHTFTPVLNGEVRTADVGLLYDPGRRLEVAFCQAWHDAYESLDPKLPVRRNYPYSGLDDGFTKHLRELFPEDVYAGVELELNHRDFIADKARWNRLRQLTLDSLEVCLRVG